MLSTKCFRHQFQILQIWKARITDAFATVTEDMLENTWGETDCRLDVLRATKGARVEVHWCVPQNRIIELHFEKKNNTFVFHVQQFSCIKCLESGKHFNAHPPHTKFRNVAAGRVFETRGLPPCHFCRAALLKAVLKDGTVQPFAESRTKGWDSPAVGWKPY